MKHQNHSRTKGQQDGRTRALAGDRRGKIGLTDVMLGFFVLVCLLVLMPFFSKFTGMVAATADPFSALLLTLVPPLLMISLIISVGVSARRGA